MAIAVTERPGPPGPDGLLLALCRQAVWQQSCRRSLASGPMPPGLHRLVLVDAPDGHLQAVLYGTLADGRRYGQCRIGPGS